MKIKTLAITFAIATTVTVCASYALDMSAVKNAAGNATKNTATTTSTLTTEDIKGTVSAINKEITTADKSVQTAFKSLVTAVSSKEDAAKIKAQLNAINANKNLTAAEKSAKIAEIMTKYGTTLDEQKATLSANLSKAGNAKKQQIINATSALKTASAQYLTISKECTGLISKTITKPSLAISLATEIGEIKSTATTLKNNAKSINSLLKQTTSLAKASKITLTK